MEQRTLSWSKVIPAHIKTSAVADGDDESSDSSCPPLGPDDVKLDATLDATPCALRSEPTATDSAVPAGNKNGVVTVERRRAKSFSETRTRAICQTSRPIHLRRHSSIMTRLRPSTVVMAQERGESFRDVFGALGAPMVLAFIFSAIAMFNQAYVQIYPSDFANLLMNTTHYDEGEFWLLEKTKRSTVAIATAMLVFFGCCYLVLVAYMLFFRHWAIEKKPNNNVILQQDALATHKRKGSVATSTTTQESTATDGDEEITVAEIAKGVLLTSLEFLRDALATAFPKCFKKQSMPPQGSVVGDADAATVQRKNAAMARRKLQRARAIYFQFSDIDGVYHAYYVSISFSFLIWVYVCLKRSSSFSLMFLKWLVDRARCTTSRSSRSRR